MLETGPKPCLVISAVNFTDGGPLTILREAVGVAVREFPNWRICAIVHRPGLLNIRGVEEIAYPQAKRSWFQRLWCEWVELGRISQRLRPDVWLSLHDMTPRVQARRRYVYCHNPAPFTDLPWGLRLKDRTFFMFSLFYSGLYRINLHRNDAVIVQQQWLRDEFVRRFGVRRVIVAHPSVSLPPIGADAQRVAPGLPRRFLYPTFPRVFKNVELLCRCAELLDREPRWQGRIVVTLDGSESAYARSLIDACAGVRSIEFIGLQTAAAMDRQYGLCDALIFPSLLETWGLPLTEAKARGIPIVAADLPYARETIGDCRAVRFVDPHDAAALAETLLALSEGRLAFEAARRPPPEAPFADGWPALLKLLLIEDAAAGGPACRVAPMAGYSLERWSQ